MKHKNKSTIGVILQWVAAVNAVLGAAAVCIILVGMVGPNSILAAMAMGLYTSAIVVILLGVAELLHAVMRTAAASEQMAALMTHQMTEAPRDLRAPRRLEWQMGPMVSAPDAVHEPAVRWAPVETKCPGCARFFDLPRRKAEDVSCPSCSLVMGWPE